MDVDEGFDVCYGSVQRTVQQSDRAAYWLKRRKFAELEAMLPSEEGDHA
jgi:hypothetical protein